MKEIHMTSLNLLSRMRMRRRDTSNFVEQLGQIRQSNLQNFLDHRVAPRGAVHVRFMMAEKKKISIRDALFLDTASSNWRRYRGSFALNSSETSDRTFAEFERHIMSISLFARFSSDKRQSRAVDCLQRLANRWDSHRSYHKNVTTSRNNLILFTFSFKYIFFNIRIAVISCKYDFECINLCKRNFIFAHLLQSSIDAITIMHNKMHESVR